MERGLQPASVSVENEGQERPSPLLVGALKRRKRRAPLLSSWFASLDNFQFPCRLFPFFRAVFRFAREESWLPPPPTRSGT